MGKKGISQFDNDFQDSGNTDLELVQQRGHYTDVDVSDSKVSACAVASSLVPIQLPANFLSSDDGKSDEPY